VVGDLLPVVGEEEDVEGGDLLCAGEGPAHAGPFHAVGAEARAGALGEAAAGLGALGQEGGLVDLVDAVGEVGGGLPRPVGTVGGAGGVRGGQVQDAGQPHAGQPQLVVHHLVQVGGAVVHHR